MKPRIRSTARLSLPLATAIAALLCAQSAHATDHYWRGVTGNWGTAGDWSSTADGTGAGAVPNSTTNANLFFNITSANTSASTISLQNAVRNAASLTFNTSGATNFRAGGANTANSTLNIGSGGITLAAGSGNVTLGQSPGTYGTLTTNLSASQSWTNNSSTAILTVVGPVTGASTSTLTKAGVGTLTLSGLSATAANNYSGTTIIDEGTLKFTTTNASLTGGLTFGASAGSTTTSALDLSTGSATFGGAFLVRTDSATANTISIGSGRTLQLNGAVTVGYNSAANSTTKLDVTGLGTLAVGTSATPTNANFRVGNGSTTTVSNAGSLDMSGLSNFSAYLGTGSFRIGSPTNSGGGAAAGSTVILAADSTINAAALVMGSPDGGVTQSLKLGSGTNIINVDTLNAGGAGTGDGRSSGSLTFNGATGTLKVRSQADPVNGRATLNVGSISFNTGTGQVNNLFDTTGHSADLYFGTMTIGSRTNGTGSTKGEFKFDTGTLNGNDLIAGNRGSSATGTTTTTGIVSLGGGTVTLNNTNGPIQLGVNSVGAGTATGTLNISGGTVTVAENGGNSIILGNATVAGGTATGNLNLTGGTLTVAGDIIRGDTTGASNATLKISGGTLDMGGKDIGATGTGAITLTAESGELKNVFSINGSGGLTKTTAGTLVLSGTNNYSGATTVTGGALIVNGNISTSILTTVGDTATLGGGGTLGDLEFEGGAFFDIFDAVGNADPLASTTITFPTTGFGIDNLVYQGLAVDWSTISNGTYTLITGSLDNTNLGNFGLANAYDVGGGRSAYFQSGSLQLVIIPEPRAALLGGIGILLIFRRRRA